MQSFSLLPQEIIDRIVFFLPSKKDLDGFGRACLWEEPWLAPLATIDRRWREAVEVILFHHLKVGSRSIDQFARCFSSQQRRRRHMLHELHYVVLDGEEDEENKENERKKGNEENKENKENEEDDDDEDDDEGNFPDPRDPSSLDAFQSSISVGLRRLFAELGCWRMLDMDGAYPGPVYLDKLCLEFDSAAWYGPHLTMRSTKEIYELPKPYLKILPLSASSSPATTVEDVMETHGLNVICPIKELFIDSSMVRLWPSSAFALARCVPVVDRLIICLEMERPNEPQFCEVTREVREDLAANLQLLPPSLDSVQITMAYSSPNHALSLPDFRSETEPQIDRLSRSVRILSQRLNEVEFAAGQLSPEIFWPQCSKSDTTLGIEPFWPKLRDFQIHTTTITTDGCWTLEGPDPRFMARDWSDPVHYRPGEPFRQKPIRDVFDKFAISVARAMIRMPQLRRLTYKAYGAPIENCGWIFAYRCGDLYGKNSSVGRTANGKPKIEWVIFAPQGQVQWTAPREARRLWRDKCGVGIEEDLITLDVSDSELFSTGFTRLRDGVQVPFLEAPWDRNTCALTF